MNFLTPIAKNLPLVFIEDVLTKNLYKQLIDFNHVNYGIGLGYSANQFKEFLELFKSNSDFWIQKISKFIQLQIKALMRHLDLQIAK